MLEELERLSLVLDYSNQSSAEMIVKKIAEKIQKSLNASIVDVRFYEEAENGALLQSFVSTGPGVKKTQTTIVKENPSEKTSVWSWVVKTKTVLWLENIQSDLKNGRPLKNLATGDIVDDAFTKISPSTRSMLVTPYRPGSQSSVWGILSIELSKSGVFSRGMINNFKKTSQFLHRIIRNSKSQRLKRSDTEKAINLFCQSLDEFNFNEMWKTVPSGFFGRPFHPSNKVFERHVVDCFEAHDIQLKSFSPDSSGLMITDEIMNELNHAGFGVFDISKLTPNVMFEIGYFLNKDKEIFIFKDAGDSTKVPFNLLGRQCHRYKIEHPSAEEIDVQIYQEESNQYRSVGEFFNPFIAKLIKKYRPDLDSMESE